jgi:hypothetical protein
MADRMARDYHGGYWQSFGLSSGGFFMAPETRAKFTVACGNGFEGVMSADALGITVCLYAYSHLSFAGGEVGKVCAEHFHRLRAYALGHPEAGGIVEAVD